MILVYSSQISNRLRYTLQFIFEDVCRIEYEVCSDVQKFAQSNNKVRINYSTKNFEFETYQISPFGLLELEGVSPIELPFEKNLEDFKLFPSRSSEHGFDIFSAVFYFISRYEEYLPFKKDRHGRFEANVSFAYQTGVLDRPIVDEWILDFKNKLILKFPELKFPMQKFEVIPTIDIDQAFAIKGKSLIRFFKPVIISILKFRFAHLFYLFKVRLGFAEDPFDQIKNFENLHSKFGLKAWYFILFSKKFTKYDINISIKNQLFRKRLKELTKTANIGIHPSYHSRYEFKLIDEEIHNLSNVVNTLISASRQHYLKMRMPNTYKSLLSLGISDEFTMGFASMPGFRAGTSHSFKFFDIKHEQITFLRIHPFCVMDATFKTYLNCSEEEAFEMIKDLIAKLKKVNGKFTPLWHNESMSGYGVWKGWQNLYERMLTEATTK